MPTYEYRCSKGHEYEKVESFSAPAMQKCITCGARSRRQISRPAVIFKGSGFYSTDNRGSSGRRDSDSSDSSSSDSAPKADPAPAASDNGHGHSHGAGGHSHGASETKTEAAVD